MAAILTAILLGLAVCVLVLMVAAVVIGGWMLNEVDND